MNYRLLIADDEEIIVDGIQNAITWETYGIEVVGVAYNGLDALALARQLKPHIILSDIKMPGLTGLQLAQKVHELLPGTRVILISAFEEFEYAREAIELGVSAYLVKPLRRREIIEKVQLALSQLESESAPAAVAEEDAPALPALVAAVRDYMLSDPKLSFGLTDVAEHVGLSPAYFSRLFKREAGLSFVEYSKQFKIEKAKMLLADRKLKIYEICDMLGYSSLQYFTTLFKSEVGCTPTEYRQSLHL